MPSLSSSTESAPCSRELQLLTPKPPDHSPSEQLELLRSHQPRTNRTPCRMTLPCTDQPEYSSASNFTETSSSSSAEQQLTRYRVNRTTLPQSVPAPLSLFQKPLHNHSSSRVHPAQNYASSPSSKPSCFSKLEQNTRRREKERENPSKANREGIVEDGERDDERGRRRWLGRTNGERMLRRRERMRERDCFRLYELKRGQI